MSEPSLLVQVLWLCLEIVRLVLLACLLNGDIHTIEIEEDSRCSMIEILTQTMHNKLRQGYLKTWVFATSDSIKKLGEPLLSRLSNVLERI